MKVYQVVIWNQGKSGMGDTPDYYELPTNGDWTVGEPYSVFNRKEDAELFRKEIMFNSRVIELDVKE